MAIALREQGVPIKIVYLGHRDGSAVMVHKDSHIYRMEDFRGKRIAVPNRFSNQRLLIFRALKQAHMTIKDVEPVEMPPPDMPAALYAKAVDAISSGEPFMGQTELDGYGRVLWLTKDVWPNFISCVLAVHEEMIKTNRDAVQRLVDGIAKSGKWIDRAWNIAWRARNLSANIITIRTRTVKLCAEQAAGSSEYTNLALRKPDFEEIEALGREAGILNGTAHFEDYTDASFVKTTPRCKPTRGNQRNERSSHRSRG